ncbi:DNA-3-methyladenine glycosylase 2 family protein [Listeria grandensis]|uniref:DNA-3-methyladenine glycosylase family protein n=1 Tax=Listeria grandensis TaxID=1494963 RepID=UPI0016288C6F|nr:DNA-3-methyladenine glycosylase [Listeria grandensis]MBC1474811.1 DNA-3-methyladenine glycosylase 2 family protein [Listeria grandensis]
MMQPSTTKITIQTPNTFRFTPNLDYLNRDAKECMHHIENNQITKLIELTGQTLLIQISEATHNTLSIQCLASQTPITELTRIELIDYIHNWFDIDRDISEFYALARTDALLCQTTQDHYGLRIISIPDLFEALCWGIIGQQINLSFAYTLKRQFVEKYGTSTVYNNIQYWTFPTAEKIATLNITELTAIQLTKRKSEYIIEIAQQIQSGALSKQHLQNLPTIAHIEKELIKIRGIGPWTANYVIMRCLKLPNAFPIDDIGLINAIQHAQQLDQKPTKTEIQQLAKNWSGWEAYATFYLWRTLY